MIFGNLLQWNVRYSGRPGVLYMNSLLMAWNSDRSEAAQLCFSRPENGSTSTI